MVRSLLSVALVVLLGACATTHPISPAVASTGFAGAEVIAVELSNFEFTPSIIRLEAGKPYALHIQNIASGGHDFTAPDFFAASKVAAEDIPAVRDGQVGLAAGESKTIHLVPSAGTYRLVCTHTGHALLGMKGSVIVS